MTLLEDRPTIIDSPADDVCGSCGHDWQYHGEVDGRQSCWHPIGRAPDDRDCGCEDVPPARGGQHPSFPSGGPIARLAFDPDTTRAAAAHWGWPDGDL